MHPHSNDDNWNNKFFWLGNSQETINKPANAYQITSLDQLPTELGHCICLDLDSPSTTFSVLKEFYKLKFSWSWTVLTTSTSKQISAITDGPYTEERFHELTVRLTKIKSQLNKANNISPLISWLGLHEDRRLTPVRDLSLRSIYDYPILNMLFPNHSPEYKLNLIENEKANLTKGKLINKVRTCGSCQSTQLNYIETCNACKSIEIEPINSIHCFTCGHINDENNFKKVDSLECPKCHSSLKHIGTDYDRPLEKLSCSCCHEAFIEPTVVANCFECDTTNELTHITPRNYHSFKLSFAGEHEFWNGNTNHLQSLIANSKVSINQLLISAEWLQSMTTSDKTENLIIAIKVPEKLITPEHPQAITNIKSTNEFFDRLTTTFCNSDLFCQYNPSTLIGLLPNKGKTHINELKQTISDVAMLINNHEIAVSAFFWETPTQSSELNFSAWLFSKINMINTND